MAMTTSELIEQFKTEATNTGAGAAVYEAKDAQDAKDYVLKLAQEKNVQHVVKSRSTLAQEIGLRAHLEAAGIQVVETDLKEWIAQLAGGKEGQATDKSIEQVAELLSQATGKKLEPNPQVLLNAARETLRPLYINGDMGISEADMAIAETGTSVTLSNEGNERLVALLPRIHVTLVDCEKMVPTLDDATAKLGPLSRELTGRKMPSYVTHITGKNTTGDIRGAFRARAQGPEEEHIVLVNTAASES